MILFCITLTSLFFIHLFFQERHKRVVDVSVQVQEQTEQAESFVFSVNFFKDETHGVRQEKLYSLCEMAEARRSYNNERLAKETQAKIDEARAHLEAERAAKSNVSPIKPIGPTRAV